MVYIRSILSVYINFHYDQYSKHTQYHKALQQVIVIPINTVFHYNDVFRNATGVYEHTVNNVQ